MPCLCGDLQCPSCGPAQGNYRCVICGKWADDPCEHIGEDGYKPEFQDEVARIEAAEAEYEATFLKEEQ